MLHARTDYNRIQDPENKIKENEPVFLLRAKDKFAPATVRMWAELVRASGDETLALYVERWAKIMDSWQNMYGCSVPDVPEEKLRLKTEIEK